MPDRTFRRSLIAVVLLAAIAWAVPWRTTSSEVRAEAADFIKGGTIVVGRTYDFKWPGNEQTSRRVVRRMIQGWIEVDAWQIEPMRAPFESAPRRWINVSTLEFIQEVPEPR